MADEALLQDTLSPQETTFDFSNRQFAWIPDSNNSSYSNSQIVFDLASLANSGKIISFENSYMTIPLVLNVNLSTACAGSVENVFAASLKQGYHQLINSLSVDLGNNSIVNLTNFSGVKIGYELMSSMDLNTYQNMGATINFAKDNAESISYQVNASAQGYGECNNTIASQVFNPTSGWGKTAYTQNAGRLQRMVSTSFDPSTSLNPAVSNFTSPTATQLAIKNYATQNTTDVVYYILATIPLKILHPVFKQLPMMKGAYMRLIVNTHCNCSATLVTNNSGSAFVSCTSSTQNGVLPFMISPCGAGNGFVPATGSATTVIATMGIAKVNSFSHQITQSRVYACLYDLSPLAEERLFTIAPTKKILYNDVLQFFSQGIAPNGTVNQILSSGISRPRYLLGLPYLSSQTNGTKDLRTNTFSAGTNVTGTGTFSTMASPFSSSPGTLCPYHTCSGFNVLVSGVALYQSNLNAKFEHFLQEIRSANALNGGVPLQISSGLISQTDYEAGYGYMYVDLSRKTGQASDDISRSIQVILTNTSSCYVDYVWFVGYEREITVSLSTGSLVI